MSTKLTSDARTATAPGCCVRRLVSTFNETFREGEFKRAGIELNVKRLRLRVGWIGGYMPTFFYVGRLASHKQTQLRIWRLAVSYCANAKPTNRASET